jgi:hypothetical protein
MSFQGDVAGIGLGELLQGLARGGRDGVLSLYGGTLTAAVGLKGGALFLLSAPDETADTWRERSQQAWAHDPHPQMETTRRGQIARAARLETLYRMLEADNLHFRFEQGPLPPPPSHAARFSRAEDESPWGQGVPVEFVLLEHARVADESSSEPASRLASYDIPRALDVASHPVEERDFLEQCDGASTLQEIADRLGWPLSQCRATVAGYLAHGALRMAQPRELLAAAQREIELGRIGRAATRLGGWVRALPPGPPPLGDADLLVGEWRRGRLPHILHALAPRDGRGLLRRLDAVHRDVPASQERWRSLAEAHRGDEISRLHEIALRMAVHGETEPRAFQDLLRLARAFRERGFERRTRTLLRLAAMHLPTRPQTRIELGRCMLEAGLETDGQRWLLDTARQLIDRGEAERALVPLRIILKDHAGNAEAHGLLIQARSLLAKRKQRRWNVAIGLATGLLLSAVALVRFLAHRQTEERLAEIATHMADPMSALRMLDESFGAEGPQRVEEFRQRLLLLAKEENRRAGEEWMTRFRDVEDEVRFGDPILGMRRALELSDPPPTIEDGYTWPERQDLFGVLAKRLGDRSAELDLPVDAPLEDLHQEERLLDLLGEMLRLIDPDTAPPLATSFRFHVVELEASVRKRRDQRRLAREQLAAKEKEQRQDLLLAAARAHDAAGDLERSLAAYDRLLAMPESKELLPLLEPEIQRVRTHSEAVARALELASAGEHGAALAALQPPACPNPREHLLPWRVDSRPPGARVTTNDGRVRVTPFVTKSAAGELIELTFELPGTVVQKMTLDRPRDVVIDLHSLPERRWETSHRVEATPVAVGDDHVVSDRAGRLVRLDRESREVWAKELATLGGIARTPIFLPGRPGHLLVLSEDGQAWLVDAASGTHEGPLPIGAPPDRGPSLTRSGASVSFTDGRVAIWKDGLRPTFYSVDSPATGPPTPPPEDGASSATMIVLRRSVAAAPRLVAEWTGWSVEVREHDYLAVGPDGRGFTCARRGEWIYLAWESPKAMIPHGRLWISDDRGLRSYLPDHQRLVVR